MKPLKIEGRTIHQIGLPYHWGYQGVVKGDVANDLLLLVAERNVSMHEAKAFTCNMRPGRRSHQGQDGSIVARELPFVLPDRAAVAATKRRWQDGQEQP
jgi:formate dehydrogenase major subunit